MVGERAPTLTSLAGFARRNGERLTRAVSKAAYDTAAIDRSDVGVGDDGVPVSGRRPLDYLCEPVEASRLDENRIGK